MTRALTIIAVVSFVVAIVAAIVGGTRLAWGPIAIGVFFLAAAVRIDREQRPKRRRRPRNPDDC